MSEQKIEGVELDFSQKENEDGPIICKLLDENGKVISQRKISWREMEDRIEAMIRSG